MKLRTKLQQKPIKLIENKKIEQNKLNPIINIFQTKAEILFNQKSFLEILLSFIKKAQVDYLTNNKLNENEDNKDNSLKSKNITKIKKILNDFKDNLLEIKKEKDKNVTLFQKQKEQKESILKKIIFNTVYSKRSVSNYNYINNNYETLVTENNENYLNKETPQLKLLNFNVENQIKKVDNLTKRIQNIIQYYKTPHLIESHLKEIFCDDKKNNEFINELIHHKLIEQREQFIEIVNMKSLQDMRIGSIQGQVMGFRNALKDIQKSSKSANNQEIIAERNKSYLETIKEDEKNENLKNSFSGVENGTYANENLFSNGNDNLNEMKNLKYLDMNEVEKLLKLNMNINVNINYNKQIINNQFYNDLKSNIEENNSSNYSKEENIDDDDSDVNNKEENIEKKINDN